MQHSITMAGSRLRRYGLLAGLCMILWAHTAAAVLTIEITKGLDHGMPVAIVPFSFTGQGRLPEDVSAVVQADLVRSGRFNALPEKDFLSMPHTDKDVIFKDWRLIKAEALVIGTISPLPAGKYQVEFRLYDIYKETQLAGYRYVVSANMLRMVAHQISDVIYEKLTGVPGAFNTRIAYITRSRGARAVVYKLQVADADGYNARAILSSPQPLMSPAWSPDGTRLAYVSFERNHSEVFVQNVISGERRKVADFRGINGAPSWSPDGTRLALSLSKDGNPEIYVMNLSDGSLTRLTHNLAIDTEPSWSPDGRFIVFTSDRSGAPQIFRMTADGADVQRLTFEGEYNAAASYSPDGKMLTLITESQGQFHAALLHLRDSALQILTDTSLDESPTFAPNGQIILYATIVHGRGVLATVSVDGRVRQILKSQEGDVREPAWSPFNHQLQSNQGVSP
ncbi:MAG: Tol-Pal system beta propeller repeat protein TolB [Acidiferrobacterales bacterium]